MAKIALEAARKWFESCRLLMKTLSEYGIIACMKHFCNLANVSFVVGFFGILRAKKGVTKCDEIRITNLDQCSSSLL